MSSVRIRRATAADATAMAELLAQLGYPANADDLPARLRAVEDEGGAIVLAIDGDSLRRDDEAMLTTL